MQSENQNPFQILLTNDLAISLSSFRHVENGQTAIGFFIWPDVIGMRHIRSWHLCLVKQRHNTAEVRCCSPRYLRGECGEAWEIMVVALGDGDFEDFVAQPVPNGVHGPRWEHTSHPLFEPTGITRLWRRKLDGQDLVLDSGGTELREITELDRSQ